jgi:hypothetical protein
MGDSRFPKIKLKDLSRSSTGRLSQGRLISADAHSPVLRGAGQDTIKSPAFDYGRLFGHSGKRPSEAPSMGL